MSDVLPNGLHELPPASEPPASLPVPPGFLPKAVTPPVKPLVKPPVKPVRKISLTHKTFASGGHELILSIPNLAIQSGQVSHQSIAQCVDPETKKVYCATTDFFKGVLPEAFCADVIPCTHIRAS